MNADDKLRDFLNSKIGPGKEFASRAEMARFLGLSQTTATKLFDFLNGKDTRFSAIVDWIEKMGISIIYPDERLEKYELIPIIEAHAGAGESFETSSNLASMYAFSYNLMRNIGIMPKNAEMMYVSGDSMQPLINNGDTVLIDKSDNKPRDGQIYVVSFGDALMVKRLQQSPHGWLLCSDNSVYSPIDIQGQELEKFKVYGRVRWIGKVM